MDAAAKAVPAAAWRADFPALDQSVHGQPLVYLDSAASAQQPAAVIDAVASTSSRTTPTFIAASTRSVIARPKPTKVRATRS